MFKQGDPADTIYIIKEGSFKLVRVTEEGEEIILQIVVSGETIGETALFRREALHPASVVALEDAKACSMSRQSFEKVIENNPHLACQIIANLGNSLYNMWDQMAELNNQTTKEKVLSLFIRLVLECKVFNRFNLSIMLV